MNINNPYKGLFPYSASDEKLFFGRDDEAFQLVELIKNNQLVVLYGESGTGKTSLINAKLFPELKRQYYFPIYIRLNFISNVDPITQVREIIYTELKGWDKEVPVFPADLTLVEYAAKTSLFNGLVHPILFFDQFEELFTLGPKHVETEALNVLISQLADLIEVRVPQKKRMSQLTTTSGAYDDDPLISATALDTDNILKYTVVFSLRQDYIAQLDDLRLQIPSITTNRYRIKKFTYSQALDAIEKPVEEFAKVWGSPMPYKIINRETTAEVINQLKKLEFANVNEDNTKKHYTIAAKLRSWLLQVGTFFTGKKAPQEIKDLRPITLSKDYLNEVRIDPTILSLYCYQLYEEAKPKDKNGNEGSLNKPAYFPITFEQIRTSPPDEIIKHYYHNNLRGNIRFRIEDYLITPDGRRILIPLRDFVAKTGVSESEIETLRERTAIIRIYGDGQEREIELAHDQIAKRALISKKARLANMIVRNAVFLVFGIIALSVVSLMYYVSEKEKNVNVIRLQEEVSSLNQVISSLRDREDQLTEENSKLEENYLIALANRKTLIREKGEFNKQIELINGKLRSEINSNEVLKASLSQAQQERQYFSSRNARLQIELARYQKQNDSLATRIVRQETELNAAKESITKLQNDNKRLNSEIAGYLKKPKVSAEPVKEPNKQQQRQPIKKK